MSVIESIRKFIREECPLLQEFGWLFPSAEMDELGEDTALYTVEIIPSEPIVKRYTGGNSIRRVSFYFASKEAYADVENMDTSEFYEKFLEWMEQCTHSGNLRVGRRKRCKKHKSNYTGISKRRGRNKSTVSDTM